MHARVDLEGSSMTSLSLSHLPLCVFLPHTHSHTHPLVYTIKQLEWFLWTYLYLHTCKSETKTVSMIFSCTIMWFGPVGDLITSCAVVCHPFISFPPITSHIQQQQHFLSLSNTQAKWVPPQEPSNVTSQPRADVAVTGWWRPSLSRGDSLTRPPVGCVHLERRGAAIVRAVGEAGATSKAHMLLQIYQDACWALNTRWRPVKPVNRAKEHLAGDVYRLHMWMETPASVTPAFTAAPVWAQRQQLHRAAVS